MPQLTPKYKELLEKQSYGIVGNHSAVKTCGWTKNMLRGQGGCYKFKFYGIRSHQCMQMTTNMSCANRCTFCWRGYKAPVSTEWKGDIDEPDFIIEQSRKVHHKFLTGFGGNPKVSKHLYTQSKEIRHVALSLTGEPILYPRFNELCRKFHKQGISTFVVTNAQYPDAIKNLKTVTQLYLSLDAPNKELLKAVDIPLFSDYWERLLKSLDYCAQKKYRTTIRVTVIKGTNDIEPENYAALIQRANADFIEIKGYMFIGASRQKLSLKNMPFHEEVKVFGLKILEHLPDYELASEHRPSNVILLAKKTYHKKTWINFEKFFELMNQEPYPENLDAMAYATLTGEAPEGKVAEMRIF